MREETVWCVCILCVCVRVSGEKGNSMVCLYVCMICVFVCVYLTIEILEGHWDTNDWEGCLCSDHAWQMGRTAGSCNDYA